MSEKNTAVLLKLPQFDNLFYFNLFIELWINKLLNVKRKLDMQEPMPKKTWRFRQKKNEQQRKKPDSRTYSRVPGRQKLPQMSSLLLKFFKIVKTFVGWLLENNLFFNFTTAFSLNSTPLISLQKLSKKKTKRCLRKIIFHFMQA